MNTPYLLSLKHVEMYRAGEYWILDNGECKRFLESARIARDKAAERGLVVIRAKHRDRREDVKPCPFRIGRNGTGTVSCPRFVKAGYYSVLVTATGKSGQPLWSERRIFTEEEVRKMFA